MQAQQIREIIRRELPILLQQDTEMQLWLHNLMQLNYAGKQETSDRFEALLEELRLDREENARKWQAQEARCQDNSKTIQKMLDKLAQNDKKYDSTIGALGARWGLNTEESFRNALKSILEDVSDLTVQNVVEFDYDGEVFGRPDQIELDIIISNGVLMICEIKSSIPKPKTVLL